MKNNNDIEREPESGDSTVEPLEQPIPIRAHILLCLQGYSGKGYSPEFIAVMDRVSQELRGNPNLEVKILAGADIFCLACPHHHRGRCMADDPEDQPVPLESPDSAVLMDKRVLNWLDFSEGDVEYWGSILLRISKSVDSSVMDALCGDCSWRADSNCANALDELSEKTL